ncbi:MAG TPA: chemotaxis protein CheB [Usitatibacter sp.]|jgi:two-component system, chemotaxis family, protein-glutamate methylesterase/glutaminase|nr:chemotaxis protein CheB [Usitatibacter sp.]
MLRDVVVIGASAGGIDALRTIASGLPRDFPAAIFVVVHISPHSPGILDSILERAGPLPSVTVRDEEPIRPGCIYVPFPDHHLVVEEGIARATRGPRENLFRPAVDPLFRSAAQAFGPRVIGVVLSGGLDDGSAGLFAVKDRGGVAIVQDPAEAAVASMPLNAMRYVQVDHTLRVARIAPLLAELVRQPVQEGGAPVPERMKLEVGIAKEDAPLEERVALLGEPSLYACPECHGVLTRLREGTNERYRCHTGHAYSQISLIADMEERIEESVWSGIRALQEKAMLLRHMAGQDEAGRQELLERAAEAEADIERLRQITLRSDPPADELRRES